MMIHQITEQVGKFKKTFQFFCGISHQILGLNVYRALVTEKLCLGVLGKLGVSVKIGYSAADDKRTITL